MGGRCRARCSRVHRSPHRDPACPDSVHLHACMHAAGLIRRGHPMPLRSFQSCETGGIDQSPAGPGKGARFHRATSCFAPAHPLPHSPKRSRPAEGLSPRQCVPCAPPAAPDDAQNTQISEITQKLLRARFKRTIVLSSMAAESSECPVTRVESGGSGPGNTTRGPWTMFVRRSPSFVCNSSHAVRVTRMQ